MTRGIKLNAMGMMSKVNVVFSVTISDTSRQRPTLNKVAPFKIIERPARIEDICAGCSCLAFT